MTFYFFDITVRTGSRQNMLRPAKSTGNLIDISSPPSIIGDNMVERPARFDSPCIESEKNNNEFDHALPNKKFYPSNRSTKSYTSTVSSKIKKQHLHSNNHTTNSINASNLLPINR